MRANSKRFIVLTFAIFFLKCTTLIAEQNPFWIVESENTTVYMYGSIHIGNADFYPLPDVIMQSFDKSDILVVEIDIKNVDIALMQKIGFYEPGNNLKKNVSDEVYKIFQEHFKKMGMNSLIFNRFKPWMAMMTILFEEIKELGYEPEYGIDAFFLNLARQKEMPIVELESAELQYSVLAQLDSLDNEAMLSMLNEVTNSALMMEKLIQAWKSGDIEKINDIAFSNKDITPEIASFYFSLNDERNFPIVEKIEEFLKSDKVYFVVVGAGHFGGENGIVNLLNQKKKYKITQK